jgi:hypothetical protein
MQPELYDQLRARCKELDTPLTVFVRDAIKAALEIEHANKSAFQSQADWAALSPDPSP